MEFWMKIIVKTNAFIFKLTNGLLGSQLGSQSVLLLHTLGRKSGKTYIAPLAYYRDGRNFLIVASNWGREEAPDWFKNLKQNPRTSIQVKGETLQVEALPAAGEEYQRLWHLVTQRNAQYLEYQKKTTRRIPIVILTPLP